MYRLLGPHCNSSPGGVPELVSRWKPAVACVLDPGPVWRGPAQGLKTRFVWRWFSPEQPDWNQALDPVAEARAWVAAHLGRMLALSGCGGWMQGYNEPVIASAEAMARYARFEAERLRLLSRYGLRGGVGAFAVGNPPEIAWWDAFHPALEAAAAHGGVLLLHEYNYPDPRGDERHDPAWLSLRHRMVYDRLPARLRVPLIISECGRDSIFGEPDGGWRGHLSPTEYAASLRWYDEELLRDAYVLGACVYCVAAESWQWSYYDILPDVSEALVTGTRPLYRELSAPLAEPRRGVDVSVWQGVIDWKKVAASGISFALIRASVGGLVDRRYSANAINAHKARLDVEPYHFLTVDVSMAQQAARFLASASAALPRHWVDVEYEARTGAGPCEAAVREMVERLQDAGATPGIYTSMSMWRRLGHSAWAGHLPLWVADWNAAFAGKPRQPAGWSSWVYQQTTSAGSVPGIAGRVDLDIAAA